MSKLYICRENCDLGKAEVKDRGGKLFSVYWKVMEKLEQQQQKV